MAGYVLFICIPTSVHEIDLIKLESKLSMKNSNRSININVDDDDNNRECEHKEERVPLLINADDDNDECSSYNTIESNRKIDKKPTIELIINDLLKTLEIDNYSWINKDEKYIQIMIPLKPCAKSEEILEIFKENIIGRCANSVLSVIPCNLFYQSCSLKESDLDGIDEDVNA